MHPLLLPLRAILPMRIPPQPQRAQRMARMGVGLLVSPGRDYTGLEEEVLAPKMTKTALTSPP